MTVYNTNIDEIKIILTHTEVIACFGSYEKLTLMGDNIKSSLSLLVSEVTKSRIKNIKDYEIKGQIVARKNYGCRIILKLTKITEHIPTHDIYSFKNSENLIAAIKTVFLNTDAKSDLYLMPDGYRLIINDCNNLMPPFESGIETTNSPIALAFTKEYGKPLILKNALFKLKKAFIKGF